MAIVLNPLCSSSTYKARFIGSTVGYVLGKLLGGESLIQAAFKWGTIGSKSYIYGLAGALAGLFVGAQIDCGSKTAAVSGLGQHYAMPEFMMPTMFDDATRLLDPRRG